METEAALRIWRRTPSYETPLRLTKFLSDGDSKAYTAVAEVKVYGELVVDKEECTNHVAKRLGTALRKLPTRLPRGEKLKDGTIQKLQNYYRIAITTNRGDLLKMYRAIWASYFHSSSSNTAGSHRYCPEGATSWCKHRRAEALGEPTPDHTPILTKAQGLAVLPIYKRLTDEKLLVRCLQGKTQNAAESLNSKIWLLCPKTNGIFDWSPRSALDRSRERRCLRLVERGCAPCVRLVLFDRSPPASSALRRPAPCKISSNATAATDFTYLDDGTEASLSLLSANSNSEMKDLQDQLDELLDVCDSDMRVMHTEPRFAG
ncbi:uncharacterized protein LOC119444577 [Dermacentor silvarum]|uniref:uncharacterized protein LOC119444577 n=1 Tax=Dermacentor silvarum TaxID=543639 RepID=UPI002101CB0D|nr:uncharacterized protein LOC119444577 [Dermacentor silvarum]